MQVKRTAAEGYCREQTGDQRREGGYGAEHRSNWNDAGTQRRKKRWVRAVELEALPTAAICVER